MLRVLGRVLRVALIAVVVLVLLVLPLAVLIFNAVTGVSPAGYFALAGLLLVALCLPRRAWTGRNNDGG